MAQVLVVDDEPSVRDFLCTLMEREGHEVVDAGDVRGALAAFRDSNPHLLLSDLRLPDGTGLDILQWVREQGFDTQVIIMTAYATAENAVKAMRMGAYDYLVKPLKLDEMRQLAAKALEKFHLIQDNKRLQAQLLGRYGLARILGQSAKTQELVGLIEKLAPSKANVLIEGESGTGKELVARALHDGSERAGGPFVPVNCGAIPETLIEAELFGHAAGAFTGAAQARQGLFEAAHHGTLLLDEIAELPAAMQVKLLRVIQERSVRRVGEDKERPIDVRLVAATNQDLQVAARAGTFRQDLFYRLNVVRIRVPPLRERREDISLLARAFVVAAAQEAGKSIEGIEDGALNALCAHTFPGNIRELQNAMERAVALASGPMVRLRDLPEEIVECGGDARGGSGRRGVSQHDLLTFPEQGIALEQTLSAVERYFIERALQRAQGVKTRAAELLGLSFRSFRYRLAKQTDLAACALDDADRTD